MLRLLGKNSCFNSHGLAIERLMRAGLHEARVHGADRLRRWRQNFCRGWRADAHSRQLAREGYVSIENFLPRHDFKQLRREVMETVAHTRSGTPYPENQQPGFGQKIHHPWGFDRFDGGTLNRFITLDPATMPAARRFARQPHLSHFSRAVTGKRHRSKWVWIYETHHGDDTLNPDIQREFHRDTFFASLKFWYFLEPVTPDQGPFVYVPGSHRCDSARKAWEQEQALATLVHPRGGRNGAFRIDPETLDAMGHPEPVSVTVPENTLVVANTFGFHRRGTATPGSRRLALYGNLRPMPFSLIGS